MRKQYRKNWVSREFYMQFHKKFKSPDEMDELLAKYKLSMFIKEEIEYIITILELEW